MINANTVTTTPVTPISFGFFRAIIAAYYIISMLPIEIDAIHSNVMLSSPGEESSRSIKRPILIRAFLHPNINSSGMSGIHYAAAPADSGVDRPPAARAFALIC